MSDGIFWTYKLNALTWLGLPLLCMIFYLCSYSDFFHLVFLIIGSHIVFNSILGLLSRPNICADSLRRLILQCLALSIISTLSHKGRWVPFSFHIWSAIPDSYLVLLPSNVHLALLLVGDLSHLCIFYHNCKGWSKHSSWSCWIPLVAWTGRDISGELNHLWILSWCHMDYIFF